MSNTRIKATVRVIVSLDVEMEWTDGEGSMTAAADAAVTRAESAVADAMGTVADASNDSLKLAKGTYPAGTARRVTGKLVLL